MSAREGESMDLIDAAAKGLFCVAFLPSVALFLLLRGRKSFSVLARAIVAVLWASSTYGVVAYLRFSNGWKQFVPFPVSAVLTKQIIGLLALNGVVGPVLLGLWAQFGSKLDHSTLKKRLF